MELAWPALSSTVAPPGHLQPLPRGAHRASYRRVWATAEAAGVLVAAMCNYAAILIEIAACLHSARSSTGLSLQEQGHRGSRREEGAGILKPTHDYLWFGLSG